MVYLISVIDENKTKLYIHFIPSTNSYVLKGTKVGAILWNKGYGELFNNNKLGGSGILEEFNMDNVNIHHADQGTAEAYRLEPTDK